MLSKRIRVKSERERTIAVQGTEGEYQERSGWGGGKHPRRGFRLALGYFTIERHERPGASKVQRAEQAESTRKVGVKK